MICVKSVLMTLMRGVKSGINNVNGMSSKVMRDVYLERKGGYN